MEISTAQLYKVTMEGVITAAVLKFETETGLEVESIYLRHVAGCVDAAVATVKL